MATAEQDVAVGQGPLVSVLHTWLATVDHKRIGILYLGATLVFFVIGGVEALLMRWQLWAPHMGLFSQDGYNQLYTMHGTTMVFLVVTPMLVGLANFLVPLMIGARDVAFPRLNAFSFWMFVFGGCMLYYSFLTNGAPKVGWFSYPPLSGPTFSRGHNTDYWILGLMVSGWGTFLAAINLITTILTLRCPGMRLGQVPLFVWMVLWTSFLILFAFPTLSVIQAMLYLDRHYGAHFFDAQFVQDGLYHGNPVFWQHMFWYFGHPEVYIMVLPAFGIISEVIPVFARKVIFGYTSVALATVGIAFISLGVWAHHMFAVEMGVAMDDFFAGASLLIAVPTGIKMFNWIATLYGGKLRFRSPLLFALGFLGMFLLGGLSGVMLAAVPLDWQVTDSYFVVAHFHYVLFGGSLFALMAGFYYWFPKMSGRMLSERLGRWQFWLLLLGFNATFMPMHVSGMLGMPRRVYTYMPGRGWEIYNMVATAGAVVMAISFLVFYWNLFVSLRSGQPAGDDPWDAWTLEWATTSPPAEYNFAVLPVVSSRRPLWDVKHPDDPDAPHEVYAQA